MGLLGDAYEKYNMLLTDIPDVVNQARPTEDLSRSVGIHVSDVVRSVAIKLQEFDDSEWDEASTLRASIGQAWEDRLGPILEERLPCFCYHPGEIEKDGIYGTPDGLELDESGKVIHEIKATWISLRNKKYQKYEGLIPPYWLRQIKSYCAMEETTRAVLHRLYLNSNYGPPQPFHWSIAISFTQAEIDTNWALIRREVQKL